MLTMKSVNDNTAVPQARAKAQISAVLNPGGRARQSISDGKILLSGSVFEDKQAAERFRILRGQLEQLAIKNNFEQKRIFAITSALPGEGKSLVSANLSRALATDPRGKALLIDCDLRKPNVHRFFNLPQGPGLSDVLLAGKSFKDLVVQVEPGLDVLTAGSPVVDSTRTIEQPGTLLLLEELKKVYNVIILDCPPSLFCAEPVYLSRLATTTLLVSRSWNTEKKLVKEAINLLGKKRVGAIVLNDCEDIAHQYGYYGYYGVDKAAATRALNKKKGFKHFVNTKILRRPE